MRKENGAIVLYVIVVCLVILTVGLVAYISVAQEQLGKIAKLNQMNEGNKNIELTIEQEEERADIIDMVPVYTPEQFSLVGSGEEVYVEQEGKYYVFGIDKTYMFYGVATELTEVVKEQLSEQLKNEIIVEMNEKGVTVSAIKAQEPEVPKLASNMVAVYWSTDGGITASTYEQGASPIYSKIDANGKPSSTGTVNPNFIEENWYEYISGYNMIDTQTSRWANGVTDDGSYWVWIPRFKYKITYKPGLTDTTSAGGIDVKFIGVEEKSGTSVYTTRMNVDGEFITQDDEGYIIHPAFEDGSSSGAKTQGHSNYVEYNNGEWDSELAGFWVAKYEMSMEDGSGNAIEPTSTTTGNVEISDTVKMVSKAGRGSWRYIATGTCYKNSYNYNRTNESHLMKNSEWGAIAYLTHSQYGRNGNEVATNNISYITAEVGEAGSSTGNIYGVYDLSGGSWEIVALWDTLSTAENLKTYGNTTIDGYTFAISGGISGKYATAYKNGTDTTNGVLARTICKTGDALKEIHTVGARGWFTDTLSFIYADRPFSVRGGHCANTESSGVFASGWQYGSGDVSRGYRVILGMEPE